MSTQTTKTKYRSARVVKYRSELCEKCSYCGHRLVGVHGVRIIYDDDLARYCDRCIAYHKKGVGYY